MTPPFPPDCDSLRATIIDQARRLMVKNRVTARRRRAYLSDLERAPTVPVFLYYADMLMQAGRYWQTRRAQKVARRSLKKKTTRHARYRQGRQFVELSLDIRRGYDRRGLPIGIDKMARAINALRLHDNREPLPIASLTREIRAEFARPRMRWATVGPRLVRQ